MKVALSEFKTHCTKILREVESTGKSVEITKRGDIVAVLTPPIKVKKSKPENFLGKLRGSATNVGDIVSPLGNDDWNVCK
ncbi:MAG: type II toxin-antitoxin system Phd/YefM family antitoxin [Nitrospinae bacterium]|nr:type II toxin-antitoxin system Phd/YefM family antitoxin [Nitrospinota bacterium]